MTSKGKYQKLKDTAISLVPSGQYYVAKKKGKSEEELKWFKRLECSRAVILAEATAAALIGDYPVAVGNMASYLAVSLPVNVEKPDPYEYELEKNRLAGEKGTIGKIRRGWHEAKTRFRDALSDPEVVTYASLALAANNLASIGGEKMLYATVPEVDNITHFAGGFGYSKLADKFYERGNVAGYLKEKLENVADRINEKKSKLHSAAKYVVKKLSEHPDAALGVGTIAALGGANELFEKAGDAVSTSGGAAKAYFGETTYNSVKDWFVNMVGSLAYYYSQNKKNPKANNDKSSR